MKDILTTIFVIGVIGGIIWLVLTPMHSYIRTYCNPQNVCRYETFQYECPQTDESDVVIGEIGKLKPESCKEQ